MRTRKKESELVLVQNCGTTKKFVLDVLAGLGIVTILPLPFGSIPAGIIEIKTGVTRRTAAYIWESTKNFAERFVEKYLGDYGFVPEAYKEPLKVQLAILFLFFILTSMNLPITASCGVSCFRKNLWN